MAPEEEEAPQARSVRSTLLSALVVAGGVALLVATLRATVFAPGGRVSGNAPAVSPAAPEAPDLDPEDPDPESTREVERAREELSRLEGLLAAPDPAAFAGEARRLAADEEEKLAESRKHRSEIETSLQSLRGELEALEARAEQLRMPSGASVDGSSRELEARYETTDSNARLPIALRIECAAGRAWVVSPENHECYGVLAAGGRFPLEPVRTEAGAWAPPDLFVPVEDRGPRVGYASPSAARERRDALTGTGWSLRPSATGETPEEVAGEDSTLVQTLATLNPRTSLVRFHVRPSGMAAYRAAAELAAARSLPFSWEPLGEKDPIEFPLERGG